MLSKHISKVATDIKNPEPVREKIRELRKRRQVRRIIFAPRLRLIPRTIRSGADRIRKIAFTALAAVPGQY
jgi:hypothetical protein